MNDLDRRPAPPGESSIDETFRGVVVFFRVLGLGWMALLVVATLITAPKENAAVVIAALVLAAVWTVVTAYVAFLRPAWLGATAFVVADFAVALIVATASLVAGAAKDSFHGGYPMSSIVVGAYAGGMRLALLEALLLGAQQVIVHVLAEEGLVAVFGNVVFIVFAVVLGWSVEALRSSERERKASEAALVIARAEQARHEERANLATRLHDSFLQTLHAIRRDADDPAQVRYLARREERELRATIDEFLSPYTNSFKAAMLAARDEVEDLYRFEIDAVVRDDAEIDDRLRALVDATREAMSNAARHSGAERADLYVEITDDLASAYVRDRGVGIGERPGGGHGIAHSIKARLEAVGGTADVRSELGGGTEVVMKVHLEDA